MTSNNEGIEYPEDELKFAAILNEMVLSGFNPRDLIEKLNTIMFAPFYKFYASEPNNRILLFDHNFAEMIVRFMIQKRIVHRLSSPRRLWNNRNFIDGYYAGFSPRRSAIKEYMKIFLITLVCRNKKRIEYLLELLGTQPQTGE